MITKAYLHGMFNRFAYNIGKPEGLKLDYNPTYGGYNMVIVEPVSGAEHMPFLNGRMKRAEMYYALYMACLAMEFNKTQNKGDNT